MKKKVERISYSVKMYTIYKYSCLWDIMVSKNGKLSKNKNNNTIFLKEKGVRNLKLIT